MPEHLPVLLNEVIEVLDPRDNEDAIDATVNGGGHAEAILNRTGPRGRLLGIDRDPSILETARERLKAFGGRVVLAEGSFANIADLAKNAGELHPSCILFDLGFSSYHLASAKRGFSFKSDEPLDMRYNPSENVRDAAAVINRSSPPELADMLEKFGEVRGGRKIASVIASERSKSPIRTTEELVRVLKKANPGAGAGFLAKVFQSIRIAVNDELAHVEKGLAEAMRILLPGGRLAVISFHSLEDRIAKQAFRQSGERFEPITKTPITASHGEISNNPRSRSAKLRAVKKNV